MIRKLCGAIVSLELLLVLVISPALLFPTFERLLVLIIVPLVWACSFVHTRRLIPCTPIDVALWVILATVVMSLFVSYDPNLSLGKVSGVLLGVLLYWAFVRRISTRRTFDSATLLFVYAGACLAVVGLLGTNWLDKYPPLASLTRYLPHLVRGLPGAEGGFQPNAVAGCLVLFIPLQVARLWGYRVAEAGQHTWNPRHRGIEFPLLFLTVATLLLSQSRGAWVGLVLGTAVFALISNWSSALFRGIAFVAVPLAAAAMSVPHVRSVAVFLSGPLLPVNALGRLELWSRAIDGIRDFPFTGMGMNTFRRIMPTFYPMSEQYWLEARTLDVAHAHNHLLQAALDLGLLGLIAYLSVWCTIATLLARVYRASHEPDLRRTSGALAVGLLAHFIFGMFDAIPLGAKVGALFWLTLAIAVSLHRAAFANGRTCGQC